MKALQCVSVVMLLLLLSLGFAGCGDDDETTDGDKTDGDVGDGDLEEDTHVDGDHVDGDFVDGDFSDGDTVDGDVVDGDKADGDFVDGDTADGDMVDGDMVDGDTPMTESYWCDPDSGLCWQDPPSPAVAHDDIVQYCENLVWAGHSAWRAACITDLRTLIRNCAATETGGTCPVDYTCTDAACVTGDCTGCASGSCYQSGDLTGDCGSLWSMSEVSDDTSQGFLIDFETGEITMEDKSEMFPVRCVLISVDGDWDMDVDGDFIDGDMIDGDMIDGDMIDGDMIDGDMIDGDMDMPYGDYDWADIEIGEIDWADMEWENFEWGEFEWENVELGDFEWAWDYEWSFDWGELDSFEWEEYGADYDWGQNICGCSCTQNPDNSYDCIPYPDGTTFTADCTWDDGEACSGWHSIVEANGEDPDILYVDGTTFNKPDWGCNSITIHCPDPYK